MTVAVLSPRFRLRLVCAAMVLAPALAITPSVARAEGTAEQQRACTPDALRLCAGDIPDVEKITACMKSHMQQLSPRCRAAFNEPAAPKPDAKSVTKVAEEPPVKTPRIAARQKTGEETRRGANQETKQEQLRDRREERQAARSATARPPASPRVAVHETRPDRSPVAAREARRLPRESDTERAVRPARPVATRVPRNDEPDFAGAPAVANPLSVESPAAGPEFASPGLDGTRVTLANMCRRGLIDPYTCSNTVPSLGFGE